MPFYRVNGLTVHIKLSGKGSKNPPKPCVARVDAPAGSMRCCGISTFLCDFELEDGGTCDAPLCEQHAAEVGRDRHLCPTHLARQRETEPELF